MLKPRTGLVVPLICQCREGGRGSYRTFASITDEARLSTKAAVRGKEKIAEHTRNAAQEMHRISTGPNVLVRVERLTSWLCHPCVREIIEADEPC